MFMPVMRIREVGMRMSQGVMFMAMSMLPAGRHVFSVLMLVLVMLVVLMLMVVFQRFVRMQMIMALR